MATPVKRASTTFSALSKRLSDLATSTGATVDAHAIEIGMLRHLAGRQDEHSVEYRHRINAVEQRICELEGVVNGVQLIDIVSYKPLGFDPPGLAREVEATRQRLDGRIDAYAERLLALERKSEPWWTRLWTHLRDARAE